MVSQNRILAIALVAALTAVASACGDAAVEAERPPWEDTTLAGRAGEPSNAWLTIDDARTPTYWLIERSSGRSFVGDDPRIAVIDSRLDAAGIQFHETRRMLANRTAQITDVAAEHGDLILPEDMLADLTFASKDTSKAWYGVLAQAYIVLRQEGRDHAEAVAMLRGQYGEK